MKKFLVTYFFFLVFLLSLFVSGVVESQDGFQYLAVARNIFYLHEPTAPIYDTKSGDNIPMSTYKGDNGKTYSPTGLGFSLALLPAVSITNLIYNHFGISPLQHFPLENDWLILFTASFTNVFFSAGLAIVLFLYLKEIGLNNKQAIIITLLSLFTTNLFVLSKHILAHMMFSLFLLLSFYFLKLYSRKHQQKYMLFSGLSFGLMAITYNATFLLALIPYFIYYLLLIKRKFSTRNIKQIIIDIIYFLLGMLPFIVVYILFESVRASSNVNTNVTASIPNIIKSNLSNFPFSFFIEGLHGQLFSPGRSFFIYTPIALIIIFFWHKIDKKLKPEYVSFLILFIIYIIFFAANHSISSVDEEIPLWHGESSWGPRYLSPLIPFVMLIVGHIYSKISRKAIYITLVPLSLFGLYVELLGVLMPYQIKFQELERKFYINDTHFTVFLYSNLLPRYSPLYMMSKKLLKLGYYFPKSILYGGYNVHFYDGIDFPFNVGKERWRSIEGTGYISFNDNINDKVTKFSFDLINQPISETSSVAIINFLINDKPVGPINTSIKVKERKEISFPIDENIIDAKDNKLNVIVNYNDDSILKEKKQILGLTSMKINNTNINLESIDAPYVSKLGPPMTGIKYHNWGGSNQDPWKVWDIHTQMFERLPDFWWIRNLYYWDIPKPFILGLLGVNVIAIIFFYHKLLSAYKELN